MISPKKIIDPLYSALQKIWWFIRNWLKKISPYRTNGGPAWPNKYQWKKFFSVLTKQEKYIFWILCFLFFISSFVVVRASYINITELGPDYGGEYVEAAIGTPRYINPVLSSTNDADLDLATIIYSSLFKYDPNDQLVPDLAEQHSAGDDRKTYEIFLKQGIKWHDGKELTADDVIFTAEIIQNPEYRSPLRANLQGVEVEKTGDYAVKFVLKNSYSPFLDNLTFGILPKHVWENVPAVSFGLSEKNLNPIGSGPYKFEELTKDGSGAVKSVELSAFKDYYAGGPYIDSLLFNFYKDESTALSALTSGNAQGISYLSANKISKLNSIFNLNIATLPRCFAVFFNQDANKILSDKNIRQAFSLATDKQKIVNDLIFGQATAINSPLPEFIWNKEAPKIEPQFDLQKAKSILDSSGWLITSTTTPSREKNIDNKITPFEVSLLTVNWPELVEVANALKSDWENMGGVKINLEIKSVAEIQERIKARQYEILLFGQILGASPDPFSFWHSSQTKDPGLNLSLYSNKDADKILEAIRQEYNPSAKVQKYIQLNNIIKQDIPAIFLYSPTYIFPTNKSIKGIDIHKIHLPSERFLQVNKWYIETKRKWK